jgi:suppressor of ftsI
MAVRARTATVIASAPAGAAAVLASALLVAPALAQMHDHATPGRHTMTRAMPMLPGMRGVVPPITPFLPGGGIDPSTLPAATPRELVRLDDGDTLDLAARLVRRTIGGKTFVMYGFNGQYPGPLIHVPQEATITVRFSNEIDLPSTIHWHGVRLDNRFDGVPELTQRPVPPGGSFVYRVRFPDAGIYWYHPHVREDIQQDMGLYGNMIVAPAAAGYYSPANREEVLMLDDIVIEGDSIVPYGKDATNYTLMGRWGTVMLVNGEPHYHLRVDRGEVVRFYLTNVSNTRIFNISFGDATIKVVASDLGKFENEQMVQAVVIAPAERYIVEVRFPGAGTYPIQNRVQALDHFLGEFYQEVDDLGVVEASAQAAKPDHGAAFETLRKNADVEADIARYRAQFERPVDHELTLTVRAKNLPIPMVAFITIDTAYFRPIEWNDAMPNMNWITTSDEVHWILRDPGTGRENMDVHWMFAQGDVVKIRLHNDDESFHPMSHPIHLHGQRFLVVAQDGVPSTNLVWKDTVLVPVGSTVDLLVELSNPGDWMLHCHIAEHLGAGMMTRFTVTPNPADVVPHPEEHP